MKPHLALILAAALTFAGCAQYASVSEKRPRFRPVRAAVGALAQRDGIPNLRQKRMTGLTRLASMAENPVESPRKKWIEPVVALLMALTTLCTAWCSYESAAWTRRSNRLMNEANALERRAALSEVQGSQALVIHASMFMQTLSSMKQSSWR